MSNYYELGNLLGRNKIMNIVIGQRGCGKTFQAKKWVIKKFIETGKEFIWVRRYKTEMKSLQSFFDDIVSEGYFDSHSLEVKGKKLTLMVKWRDTLWLYQFHPIKNQCHIQMWIKLYLTSL